MPNRLKRLRQHPDTTRFARQLRKDTTDAEHPERDQKRDTYLRSQGFQVLRFDNHTALTNTEAVLETILKALDSQSPPRGGDVAERQRG